VNAMLQYINSIVIYSAEFDEVSRIEFGANDTVIKFYEIKKRIRSVLPWSGLASRSTQTLRRVWASAILCTCSAEKSSVTPPFT
jgi:hypothetical protein